VLVFGAVRHDDLDWGPPSDTDKNASGSGTAKKPDAIAFNGTPILSLRARRIDIGLKPDGVRYCQLSFGFFDFEYIGARSKPLRDRHAVSLLRFTMSGSGFLCQR